MEEINQSPGTLKILMKQNLFSDWDQWCPFFDSVKKDSPNPNFRYHTLLLIVRGRRILELFRQNDVSSAKSEKESTKWNFTAANGEFLTDGLMWHCTEMDRKSVDTSQLTDKQWLIHEIMYLNLLGVRIDSKLSILVHFFCIMNASDSYPTFRILVSKPWNLASREAFMS